MSAKKAPLGVKILAGVSIVLVGFRLASSIVAYASIGEYRAFVEEAAQSGALKLNDHVQFAISVALSLALVVFSALLLRPNNGYRLGFIGLIVASNLFSILTSAWSLPYFGVKLAALAIVCAMLFTPKAWKFYSQGDSA